ncbi:MAG: DUF6573 family protein [Pirellulales bacterium]
MKQISKVHNSMSAALSNCIRRESESHTEESEVFSTYTRAQAIEDGVLIDVSDTARELAITFPFAMTATCWVDAVSLPCGADWDTEQMRMNVLIERATAELVNNNLNDVRFSLYVIDEPGVEREVKLRATFGPGDGTRSVITVMLEDED